MTSINLRPWREERNERLQKRFQIHLAIAAAIAAGVVFTSISFLDLMTSRQEARNAYLNQELVRLDAKLKEITDLKVKRERLLERLNAIQQLQGNRPLIVRTFDEMSRVAPDGVHYTSLTKAGEVAKLDGLAATNEDVSALMRNLNDSEWFGEPTLSKVSLQGELRAFNLTVPLEKPEAYGGAK
ncbi:PilN domain-containing protein [Marinobacterium sp. LSUCC0821]|uniref:PilN domain-containing protein n=1 Tax=Marinobacterium sp. LSUCC0821 TaxID=2668067 RepID=UPI0014519DC6|nr:PilN domain-containing protein [Marinobacterium sp. LSUCC0821]QJD71984.1 pilus assembly protein PilN [Marinobacterium sp. LSUCC0821]